MDMNKQKALVMLLVAALLTVVTPRVQAASVSMDHPADFPVEFTDCVESIGVTLVSTERARAYVPAPFILAGEGQPVTPLVVRTARCRGIAVNGYMPKAGEIVQIGLVIVPPDFTGDINNYTLWYYTSDAKLATQLRDAGVAAQHVPTIDYDFDTGDNSLFVRVPRPGSPRLALFGTVSPSPNPAGAFLANWWQQADAGRVKMSTQVPTINIGGADLTLMTDPSNPLGQLIGSGSIGFPIIQQFNTFTTAHMGVSVIAP